MSCFLREQLNHLLVVLVSIPVCLLFLSILVASGQNLTLSSLMIISIYLLLRWPTIRFVWQLIHCGDHAFSIDIQDAYLLIPVIKHYHHFFYYLFETVCHISGKFYLLGWPGPLGFSQPSLNLSCSFAIHKGFHFVIYLDDNLVMVFSEWTGKRPHSFCIPYWFTLD